MQNIIVLCRHCESPISFSFFRFRFGPHEYCHPTAPTLSSKAGRLLLGRPHLLLSRRCTSIAIQAAEGVVHISSSLGGARVLPSKLQKESSASPPLSAAHEYCHPSCRRSRPHLLLSRRRTSIAIQAAEGVVRISSSLGGARVLPSKLHLLSPPRPDVSFPGRTGVELHFISSIQEGSASGYYMYDNDVRV
jgi:hypothetical protein